MAKNLPPLPHNGIPLGDLAKDWECTEEKIIHYGIAGQLKICALSGGWELQEGYYADDDPDGFPVPVKERWSNMGELLVLTPPTLRKILSYGEVTDPEFVFEEGEEQNKSEEQYERFLSSTIISQDMRSTQSKVVVRKADLVVRREDAQASQDNMPPESKTEHQTHFKEGQIKQKRYNELHELVGSIIIKLGYKHKKAQSRTIWNHLRKEQEEYECIHAVDDNTISWISRRGVEQKMQRETFDNLISEYNTGKRPYPEN